MMSLVFFVVVVHFGRSNLVICREMKIEHYREFFRLNLIMGKKGVVSSFFDTDSLIHFFE